MGKHLKDSSGRFYGDGKGVGYRNPPGRQWKPGESGNPDGRARSASTRHEVDDREALRLRLTRLFSLQVEIGGEEVDYLDVMLRNMVREAATGSKAAHKVLALWLELGSSRDASQSDDLSEDERIIVDDAARRANKRVDDQTSDVKDGPDGEDVG